VPYCFRTLYGNHSIFSLPKSTRGQYSNEFFFVAEKDGSPHVTTNVTLKWALKAAFLSNAEITLSVLLSDAGRNELDIVQLLLRVH